MKIRFFCSLSILILVTCAAFAQTTEFTYQGKLTDGGNPANNNYDLQFALFDGPSAGTQIGSTLTRSGVIVSAGVFTVQLDFGISAFPGANRYLEISVRPAGSGSFTTLSPRQQISSTPYAIRTLSAVQADALSNSCAACVLDAQINTVAGSKVSGAIPVASVPAGSTNYIHNSTTQQAGATFNIGGSGTTGSLNVNSAFSLGGSAPPPAAPGQGRIYFDIMSNKVRVSENGGPFVNLVGAGGVSGSGTTNTIPLWSGGTTLGNSLITQSASGVQLPNNVQLGVGAQGNQVQFGSPNSETGMTISGASGRADLRFDGILKLVNGPGGIPSATNGIAITTAGNVGIGTTSPIFKADVVGNLRAVRGGSNDILVETTGDTNSWARLSMKTANQRWVLGTSQNFNGDQFYLYDDVSQQLRMTIQPGGGTIGFPLGSVGIGTSTPGHRLSIGDGPFWTSNFWKGALEMTNGSAIGWQSNGAGNRFGIGQTNGGLYFFRTASNPGQTSNPAVYDMTITDTGNITQPTNKGGLVKAMMYVDPFLPADQYIVRCYNGVTDSSTGNCGFRVNRQEPGIYLIDFGFQVNNRFLSLTISALFSYASLGYYGLNGVSVYVTTADSIDFRDSSFWVLVY